MISEMHTTNRQSFKKVASPFKLAYFTNQEEENAELYRKEEEKKKEKKRREEEMKEKIRQEIEKIRDLEARQAHQIKVQEEARKKERDKRIEEVNNPLIKKGLR